MELNPNVLTETIAVAMLSLLVGILVIRVTKLPLKTFHGVYLFLGAAHIALHYFVFPQVSLAWLIIPLVASALLVVLATGFLGRLKSSLHYETALVGIGLFPWWLGLEASLVYVGAFLIVALLVNGLGYILAFRSVYRKPMSLSKARATLTDEQYTKLTSKISMVFLGPIVIATVISAIAYAVS